MSSSAPRDALSLTSIREALIRQEDTIIFALIERAQFALNAESHDHGSPKYAALTGGAGTSLLEFMLLEEERSHARLRRYTAPDEHAFFPSRLPTPMIPKLVEFPEVLHPTQININAEIMQMYKQKVLPGLCSAGDDGHHGSSVVADIAVLQAISKRVHYGFFVAESKFRAQTAEFTRLIEARDEEGIMALLTHAAVEEKVLRRVRLKASTFGLEIDAPPPTPEKGAGAPPLPAAPVFTRADSGGASTRVDPELIVRLYREDVIPLTKVAEVKYLLQRLTPAAIAHHGAPGSACALAADAFLASGCPAGRRAPDTLCLPSVGDVFEAVSSNKAYHGIVLLEVGDSGLLSEVRHLLKESSLRIVGEVMHEARFHLIGKRGASLPNITTVVGRAEVLRLCRMWLRSLVAGGVDLVESSAAHGAEPHANGTATGGASAALVGSKRTADGRSVGGAGEAAVAYLVDTRAPLSDEMTVLATAPAAEVEVARCAVVTKGANAEGVPSGRDHTIIFFTLTQQAGSLAQALDALHRHGVNLLSIRSYVDVHDERRVDFVVTAQGHERDLTIAGALDELRSRAAAVKVFGSFKHAARP